MSEQTEISQDAPSGEAFDLLAALKSKDSKDIFDLNILRIRSLLTCSSYAIEREGEVIAASIETLDNVALINKHLLDDSYSGSPLTEEQYNKLESWVNGISRHHDEASGSTLTEERYNKLKSGLSLSTEHHDGAKSGLLFYGYITNGLNFYLHNMLLVAVWSAFEGYMQGALAELFTLHPSLLSSSDRKISIEEFINNRDNVVEYIIAKEIDEIGRKNLKDLQSYIRGKLKIQFSNHHFERMQDVYFLRNVISHSAGFLRKDQLGFVPEDVDVCNLELRISQSYLNETLDCIREAVSQFYVQVKEKFGFGA